MCGHGLNGLSMGAGGVGGCWSVGCAVGPGNWLGCRLHCCREDEALVGTVADSKRLQVLDCKTWQDLFINLFLYTIGMSESALASQHWQQALAGHQVQSDCRVQ